MFATYNPSDRYTEHNWQNSLQIKTFLKNAKKNTKNKKNPRWLGKNPQHEVKIIYIF